MTEFGPHKKTKDGYQSWCRECASAKYKERYAEKYRFSQLKRRYGITQQEYEELAEKQGHTCANPNCDEPLTTTSHLDHCHETGKVRGILCPGCNVGLGHFGHNVEKLKGAIEYLNG